MSSTLIQMNFLKFLLALYCANSDECLGLDNCPQLLELIKSRKDNFGTRNLLRRLTCRNEGRKTYVKCISQSKIEEYIDRSDLLPSQDKCGLEQPHSKISGGEKTDLGEFPWIALLRYKNASGFLNYGCHANLINQKYLLTAGHCIDQDYINFKDPLLGKVHSAILGEYDIRNKTDCIYYVDDTDCADEVKEYVIESYLLHPDYNIQGRVNDIALIRLQGAITYSDYIKPICLPPNALYLFHNETWLIGGWGQTADYKMNDIKMKANFQYREKNECFININLTKSHICAGSVNNAKTCPGDSGGPLMMLRELGENIQTFLIGVTSLGANCNSNARITIFSKVSAYTDWIVDNLNH